jgi:hypothetical protein
MILFDRAAFEGKRSSYAFDLRELPIADLLG